MTSNVEEGQKGGADHISEEEMEQEEFFITGVGDVVREEGSRAKEETTQEEKKIDFDKADVLP